MTAAFGFSSLSARIERRHKKSRGVQEQLRATTASFEPDAYRGETFRPSRGRTSRSLRTTSLACKPLRMTIESALLGPT